MEYLIETMKFSKEFILHPVSTSSIVPSSKSLSSAIASNIDLKRANNIVEFGCGTGVITDEIIKRIGKNSKLFSFDTNAAFIEMIRKKYPQVQAINDSAENARRYIEKHSINKVDVVVSSLPWAAFDYYVQKKLLNTINDILSSKGEFITYAYLHTKIMPSHKRFIKMIRESFKTIIFSSIIWLNLPPAFIIKCVKD